MLISKDNNYSDDIGLEFEAVRCATREKHVIDKLN